MIPAGYMSKKVVVRPEWLKADGVEDVCAVSGCFSEPFADYINYWKHNGFWLFNSISDIEQLCSQEKNDASHNTLFYYEVFENEYDEDSKECSAFEPEASFETHVQEPLNAKLVGYDVTTFTGGTSPECSPLSCNSLATEIPVNRHCLFDTFEQAIEALEAGKFDNSEPAPGRFRIFAVYRVEANPKSTMTTGTAKSPG
jgi:hypothetical protein